ncbi:hypothetical protein MLD38_000199 [Melastoma candidum]|uniref:Uncharacterized protein n=1 Tax=Melastoma candidum TaxID=119954 RepID=A0ACB9S8N7_9MYRT|nr:hypothetical protein MLD38_000199 [Melastoma candidum]
MASIRSVPFLGETKLDNLFVSFKSGHLRKASYHGFRRRKFAPLCVLVGSGKCLSFCCDNGSVAECSGRVDRLRVTAQKKEGGGGQDGGDDVVDPLEATIEKSKKVLAIQSDLIQQIAERRKLVSSIKSSVLGSAAPDSSAQNRIASSPKPDVSYEGTNDSASSPNISNEQSSKPKSPNAASMDDARRSVNNPSEKKTRTVSLNSNLCPTADVSNTASMPPMEADKGVEQHVRPSTSVPAPPSVQSSRTLYDRPPDWPKELPPFVSSVSNALDKQDKRTEDSKVTSPQEDINKADNPSIEEEKPPPLAGVNVMNIILIAAECVPWSKTGGLGDVAGSLPKALARRGHRVMVVVPRYGNYQEAQDIGVRKMYKVAGQDVEVTYFQAYIDGVDFVFIDSHMFRHMENNIYGGNRVDILRRMVLFCKAAVEVPWHVPCGGVIYGDGNLVFIANDWHTALLPVYLKAYYRDNGLMSYTRCVLVIHNIAHQGRGPMDDFSYVDLPEHYLDHFRLYDPVGGEHFNIFAAGLKCADRVITVSHGYAWELKTSEGGWGLHNIINEIDWKFCGIVNGIDTREWNPLFDVHLASEGYTNYSLDTLKTGKPQCKEALQKELGLPVRPDVPLLGFIGRLDGQKGVDLIVDAVPWLMGQDIQLVMLGTGRQDLEQMLQQLEGQHPDRIRGWVGFSVKMAHRITAAADILLMPSRFEPCGLNQLYAMMYGTIPVVHAVGGLRDTVKQFDPFNNTGLGWTFDSAEANKLINALGHCLKTYREYKETWEGIQKRGMSQDLSWDNAATNYEEVLVAAKYQW